MLEESPWALTPIGLNDPVLDSMPSSVADAGTHESICDPIHVLPVVGNTGRWDARHPALHNCKIIAQLIYGIQICSCVRLKLFRNGLIILVIGILLVVAGIGISSDYVKTGTNINTIKSGFYTSNMLNISGNGFISVEGGNFSFYLIKAADLGSVNSSNILSYALNPQNASHPTVGQLFVVPQGSYYLVSFAIPLQGLVYSYVSHYHTFTYLGSILVIGILLIVVSIVVLILSLVMKDKKTRVPE